MTKRECEDRLIELAEQMWAVFKEYNKSGDFMTAIMSGDVIMVSDCYFMGNELVRDVHDRTFRTIDVRKHIDGTTYYD